MTYEQAIQTLSSTPYDVALFEGKWMIYETTAEGQVIKRKPEQFKGDWEEAVIMGAEFVMANYYRA